MPNAVIASMRTERCIPYLPGVPRSPKAPAMVMLTFFRPVICVTLIIFVVETGHHEPFAGWRHKIGAPAIA
jgi:hypothetical protein